MKKYVAIAALILAGLIVGQTMNAGGNGIKSGPQVGENARPKPFFPLNLNGPTPDRSSAWCAEMATTRSP